MNNVKTPTPPNTAADTSAQLDEQALGKLHQADASADAASLPQALPGAPMEAEAPLPAAAPPLAPEPTPAPEAVPVAQTEPASSAGVQAPDDIAAKLAEAEQRGYLRGRNEAVKLAMDSPALWQVAGSEISPTPSDSDTAFLRHIRPSVWD